MSWVAVGVGVVGAGTSYMNNQAKKKQETAQMNANAAAMQYAPWTGQKTQMMGRTTGSDLGAALGGGMQGAMIGAQLSKLGGGGAASVGDSGAGAQMAQGPQLEQPQVGQSAMQAAPQASMIDASKLQSPSMPTPAEMPQTIGYNQPGSQGSPWQNMASLKKPSMYGSY